MRASLIVTTYNRPDALHLVLQSVLQQTVPPAEIIVADDGSGADTAETVGRFAKTSPIPVKHVWQEDQGFRAAQSRNRALAAAQGPYIVLIDGDMVLHPEFIADHLSVAREGRPRAADRSRHRRVAVFAPARAVQAAFLFAGHHEETRRHPLPQPDAADGFVRRQQHEID